MKRMSYTGPSGPYGARLFFETPKNQNYLDAEIEKRLANLSVWGGCDKRGRNFEAYEFSAGQIGFALEQATQFGYHMDNHDWQEWA